MLMDTNGHTILSEDYVSFEVAKLLKEKGFDEPLVNYYYTAKGERVGYLLMPEVQYLCPTHQMAKKWLRETHKLFIEVHIEQGKKVSYKFIIWDFYIIHPNKYIGGTYDFREEQEGFSTPEQAVEAALKYSLENLI